MLRLPFLLVLLTALLDFRSLAAAERCPHDLSAAALLPEAVAAAQRISGTPRRYAALKGIAATAAALGDTQRARWALAALPAPAVSVAPRPLPRSHAAILSDAETATEPERLPPGSQEAALADALARALAAWGLGLEAFDVAALLAEPAETRLAVTQALLRRGDFDATLALVSGEVDDLALLDPLRAEVAAAYLAAGEEGRAAALLTALSDNPEGDALLSRALAQAAAQGAAGPIRATAAALPADLRALVLEGLPGEEADSEPIAALAYGADSGALLQAAREAADLSAEDLIGLAFTSLRRGNPCAAWQLAQLRDEPWLRALLATAVVRSLAGLDR